MAGREKIIIVGSGPAGLSAAIYASRGGLNPLVLTGSMLGGYPTTATDIEDYPGFPNGISGPELAKLFQDQAERFGTKFKAEEVVSVDFGKTPFEIKTEKNSYKADSVILATGSNPLFLGVPGEKELLGRGVSICATCDGPFFKGKKVIVVGGGDTALKEAIYLSKIASEVTIIHRRDIFRAQEALQEEAKKSNIKILFSSKVLEILGSDKVVGIKVKSGDDKIEEIEADGVFVAIGHAPATEFLEGQIDLDERGFIKSPDGVKTSKEGIFAAGDIASPRYKQIVISAGSGAKAALMAEDYLDSLKS